MTVPYLVWCQTRIHEAVATSAAVGLPIAIAGSIGYIVLGINDPLLPDWSTGYLYWPALVFIAISSLIFAPVGANLAHRLPTEKLRRVFALLLAILGVVMLLK